jgi:hypothetical protein
MLRRCLSATISRRLFCPKFLQALELRARCIAS